MGCGVQGFAFLAYAFEFQSFGDQVQVWKATGYDFQELRYLLAYMRHANARQAFELWPRMV